MSALDPLLPGRSVWCPLTHTPWKRLLTWMTTLTVAVPTMECAYQAAWVLAVSTAVLLAHGEEHRHSQEVGGQPGGADELLGCGCRT